ncbi:hypothetical protein P280DRAFT_549796 [Massarina eburnea CBS 473.64]|uniref:Uncharacterized protein n=1 Tax=Massarina eburnea CBS 473.64 TaxID=1395130 RepID=A0A6A6RXP7_9PLEO|nr:hypothetical protein P280DRAFT_549796 [Massarina eburnea CBS 473.64]
MARIGRLFAALASLPLSLANANSFLPYLAFTSPSPHIFHTLATLLQVRPQTIFPNGHTIASVTIPPYTLLYHGRHDNDAVSSPEWLAFDIDMAYWIMGNMRDSRMLTYRVMREVKAMYFDGTSASLMGEGTFSQMVFLYNGTDGVPKRGGWGPPPSHPDRPGGHGGDHGKPPRKGHKGGEEDGHPRRPPPNWNPLEDEYFRARGLCQWISENGLGGPGWGYEGIVRMNVGFEIIWCDFHSPSLKLVSNLNVSAPRYRTSPKTPNTQQQLLGFNDRPFDGIQSRLGIGISQDEGPHGPSMTDPSEPFRNGSGFFWFSAAAKRYAGDNRIRVDPSGIFSFYENGLKNQTHTRMVQDIERLGLGPNGEWLSKRSLRGGKGLDASRARTKRETEMHNLLARRRHHRLTAVDRNDGAFMREAVETRLKRSLSSVHTTGRIDWHNIASSIVTHYSVELLALLYYLEQVPASDAHHSSFNEWITQSRQYTHWFLLPFLEYPSDRPYASESLHRLFGLDSSLAQKTLERCVSQYDNDDDDDKAWGEEDTISSTAIHDTLHGLCSTVVKIGLGIEVAWFQHFDSEIETSSPTVHVHADLTRNAREWIEDMEELLAWLGWAEQSSQCEKPCGPAEMCYMPMWPVGGWGRRRPGGETDPEFLWEPVCVSMEKYPPEQWSDRN